MSLIELKNIGKIYVSENSVAVGVRGVNAKMDIGEFIAVTGASGSGKTTLLNVISGMDTYEEGELLICGEPTSHYIQSDWEEYREKYISFIFQDYNILESFTVLQNVELALTHIKSKKERRKRAEFLIEKVGLTRYKHHKGSKLSGGQKQRTVIARALAKDSPIILADEPTGNLDSASAKEIIELLREISAEKLVVVVTHSFEEVKDAATRELRIFDGRLERDTVMRETEKRTLQGAENKEPKKARANPFSGAFEGIELGVHRFFAKPKLAVFMSIIMVVAILATFFITALILGNPDLFSTDYVFTPRDGRVAITRIDGQPLAEEEISALSERLGADTYLRFDGALDIYVRMRRPNKDYGTIRLACRYGVKDCTPSAGRLPESGEVYLKLPIEMKPAFGDGALLIDTITTNIGNKYKVSGVEYFYDNGKDAEMLIREDDFERMTLREFFATKSGDFSISYAIVFKDGGFTEYTSGNIVINEELSGNEIAIVGEYSADDMLSVDEFNFLVHDGYKMGGQAEFPFEGVYNAAKSYQFTERYMNGDDYSYLLWGVHISPDLALQLLESSVKKTYPQSSLFFENDKIAKQACEGLKEEGYLTLTTDAFYFNAGERLLDIIMGAFYVFLWVVAIVFLCFFLSLCISKNVETLKKDVGILRSMGIKNNAIKISMFSIMALAAIPALIVFAAVAIAVYTSPTMNPLVPFIHAPQYAFIVIGMLIIVMRLAGSNNKKIFRQSVRKTLRGGNGE